MSDKFTLLLGGDLTATDRLKAQVAGSRVIAADGGIAHASALEVEPELWLGDFDSTGAELAALYQQVPRQDHPEDKDATDGELAIEAALARGARRLLLAGAFGGQADHSLAHVMALFPLQARGVDVMLSSGHEEAWPLVASTELVLGLPVGARLSILPVGDLEALTLQGVRWPLQDRDVPLGSSLTLSNEATEPSVRISANSGKAVVLVYPGHH
jgi:thiamine pyrophosphokinase